MLIYRARLRNTSNALLPRVSLANRYVFKSRLNCSESTAGPLDNQAVNSRLLVRLQKKHGIISNTNCHKFNENN